VTGDFDTWVICRHLFPDTGKSAVVTVNTTLEGRLRFTDYPYYVSIAIDAAASALDGRGRIGPQESQHLLTLSRVIRTHLETEEQHLVAIVHGAGARSLALYARDGDAIERRLNALKDEKTWDRAWRFEVRRDAEGKLSERWREIANASQEHHLTMHVPHGADSDHHHFLF
jgi:Family of unknown function (DUF695)